MNSNRKEFFSMFYGSLSNYDSIDVLKEIAIKSKPVSMSFDHRLALTSWLLWERVLNKHPNLRLSVKCWGIHPTSFLWHQS